MPNMIKVLFLEALEDIATVVVVAEAPVAAASTKDIMEMTRKAAVTKMIKGEKYYDFFYFNFSLLNINN